MSENFNVVLIVKERLMLSRLFPQKATLAEQILVRDLVVRLGVTEEEKKELNFKRTPRGWEWDDEKEKVVEASFTEEELKFLNEQLERLDKEKTITQDMVELCLKIKMFKKEENDECKNKIK